MCARRHDCGTECVPKQANDLGPNQRTVENRPTCRRHRGSTPVIGLGRDRILNLRITND